MAKKQPDLEAIDRALARKVVDGGQANLHVTVRDYFAAHALVGAFHGGDTEIDDAVFARRAYELADAMIAQRHR
jgi:hypothetical protein